MVLGTGDITENVTQLPRIVPALGLATIGLVFCISGSGRLMPLPDIDNEVPGNLGTGSAEKMAVLSALSELQSTDKLRYNNAKPLMQQFANNESITSSKRQLLRNRLKSTCTPVTGCIEQGTGWCGPAGLTAHAVQRSF